MRWLPLVTDSLFFDFKSDLDDTENEFWELIKTFKWGHFFLNLNFYNDTFMYTMYTLNMVANIELHSYEVRKYLVILKMFIMRF